MTFYLPAACGRFVFCLVAGTAVWLGSGAPVAVAQQPVQTESMACLLLPVTPASRAAQASIIVEARVLDAVGVEGTEGGHLFTRHRLRVFSVLKGALADTTALTVLTEGGSVGLRQETLTNTLRLVPGQQGVFFLTPAPWEAVGQAGRQDWAVYGSQQGFIRYDVASGTAAAPFESYPTLNESFYRAIAGPGAPARRIVRPNPELRAAQASRVVRREIQAASISQLQPTLLTAGTEAVLTITGAEFGASRGSGQVRFANADDGGRTQVAAREEDYLSWTDTQIRVRVPSYGEGGLPAGSGRVQVVPSGQAPVLSSQPLTIIYALTNVQEAQSRRLDRPSHVNLNERGGLSFQLAESFRASAFAPAWRRALLTWRCQTGVNWDENPAVAPTSAATDDDRNVVSFDNGTPLPAGVLGRTTTYYRGCFSPTGELVFTVSEVDMQFSSSAVFQAGPLPAVGTQIDFETVAVHELGHAQQLSHIILPGAVMHFAIARGQTNRQLEPASDVAGGRQVLRTRSFVKRACDAPAMLPAPLTTFSLAQTVTPTLSWTTRDECFLTEFVVERSVNADTLAWQSLATVPAGSASMAYRYLDAQPAPGLRYYRLRLRRPDGSLDNTAPVAFSTDAVADIPQFFPNPLTGPTLQFIYPAGAASTLVLIFYDELGRRFEARAVSVRAELNVLQLDVSGLSPGFYVLTWRDTQSGRRGSQKVVRL